MMEINSQTKLTDVLDRYPWLPDELIKLDSRVKVIKTPIGKMMIRKMTVADLSKQTGMSEEDMKQQLSKMIEAHEG